MSDNMTSRAIAAAVDVMKNCGVDMLGGMLHRATGNSNGHDGLLQVTPRGQS